MEPSRPALKIGMKAAAYLIKRTRAILSTWAMRWDVATGDAITRIRRTRYA